MIYFFQNFELDFVRESKNCFDIEVQDFFDN